MKYKILIVEDEPDIVALISNRLDPQKYDVSTALDGKEALRLIQTEKFDLVSLDIMLPFVDGLTLCSELRKNSKKSLIIIVSALDLDESKEKAYSLGADDYIAKPFSTKLLALKVESLLKRRFELTHTELKFKQIIQYDKTLKRFYINNKQLALTPSEYMIFETLFTNSLNIFSKEDLSQILYNNNLGNIDRDGIGTHIYTLRKKIAEFSDVKIIKTVRSVGYMLYES